jgi:hypothetical protein
MPDRHRQFRVLYRDFLTRLVDLEILSSGADVQRLLVQFAAMLAAASFTYTVASVPNYVRSNLPLAQLLRASWSEQEFLIASTMAVAGLFGVLAWNTVLPDRRDCLILGMLPVRVRTIFLAKVAAIRTALGISVAALNSFTGLSFPFIWGGGRMFAAYWLTQLTAALFVCCALLALQAVAALILPHRLFLRVSSFLQLGSFFVNLGVWFLKPPFTALAQHPALRWLPSFWFFGLFQELNGGGSAEFAGLASRAAWALAVVCGVAAASFALAYRRNLRSIVEQPDIAPAHRLRFRAKFLRNPVERAVVLFTVRTIARSRQHRLILAAYLGIALAIGLAYVRDLVYGPSSFEAMQVAAPWNQPNGSFLAATLIALFFAVIGARAVFAMPIALRANWVFRLTAVHRPEAYFRAVRKSLYLVAVLPVCLGAAALLFAIWPADGAAEHVALMTVTGALLVELSLYRFRKIPFACSYLPGKANLNVRLGAWGVGFLFVAAQGVHLEFWAMQSWPRYAVVLVMLTLLALWARRRSNEFAVSPANQLLFEEVPPTDIHALDLRPDAVFAPEDQYAQYVETVPRAPFNFRIALEQTGADLRYGVRILRKSPGFSAAAIALIALGIGGNTTVYSLIHSMLSKAAPGVRRQAGLHGAGLRAPPDGPGREQLPLVSGLRLAVAHHGGADCVSRRAIHRGPERRYLRVARHIGDAELLPHSGSAIGARTRVHGRGSARRGAAAGHYRVPRLAESVSRNAGRDREAGHAERAHRDRGRSGSAGVRGNLVRSALRGLRAHRRVRASRRPRTGAGRSPSRADRDARATGAARLGGRGARRVRRDFGAHAAGVSRRLRGRSMLLAPYSLTQFGPITGPQTRLFMAILTGIAILGLLMVCANVANLMLSRAVVRQREMAVRQSIGASRWRIVRTVFAEGLVLSLLGACAAMLFAAWACRAVAKFAPALESGVRFGPDFAPDWRVALYSVALAVASTLLFTLAPGLRSWGQDLLPWLRAGEHSVTSGRSKMASLLVIG